MLIQLKAGAFSPGMPVQPVLMRYPYKYYNPVGQSGANGGIVCFVFRMLTQFYNSVEVEFLDVYDPSIEEKADPILFANNVRAVMAHELDVPTTEHSYGDAALCMAAMRAKVSPSFVVKDVEGLGASVDDIKRLLAEFKKYDIDGDGRIDREEFHAVVESHILGSAGKEEVVQSMFDFFDTNGDGCMQFREFVQAILIISGAVNDSNRVSCAFIIYDRDDAGSVNVDDLRTESHPFAEYPRGKRLNFDEFQQLVQNYPHLVDEAFPVEDYSSYESSIS